MKDIAKMREEMERKIRLAEMSNEIEEKVGIACTVMGESSTQKGKTWISFGEVTKEQAAKILKTFPWTEKSKKTKSASDNSVLELSYLLWTKRYPKEPFTKLEIEWIHEQYSISFEIELRPDDEVLMGYFKRDWYELSSDSIGLYYGAVSSSDRENLSRQPVLSFNCGSQIRYYGGSFFQMSEGHAECIVSEIIGE